jgi:hypothetical protein
VVNKHKDVRVALGFKPKILISFAHRYVLLDRKWGPGPVLLPCESFIYLVMREKLSAAKY